MRKLFIVFIIVLQALCASAQEIDNDDSSDATGDSIPLQRTIPIQKLSEVVITAYEQFKNRMEIPAAIGIVRGADLNRYNSANILPAVNNIPGVRMEERSPGSFRFGIRGSASNAPFGVRNIKLYYNDIPYTDPGGNSYLNALGFYNIRSLEVIKEPGSSLYGAGTGGVLLINSYPEHWQRGVSAHYTNGSYNLQNIAGEVRVGDSSFQNTVTYQHLSSDGYREQSALRKNIGSWDAIYRNDRGELSSHFLYSDLTYGTPGGLTQVQFDADPRKARPAAGPIPGAVQNKATVYQKLFLAGFTYKYSFNAQWQHITTLYGTHTQLINPTIRNYSRVLQPHFGGRATLKFNTDLNRLKLECLAGAEAQQGYSSENTYDNNAGDPGRMQQQIEVNNRLMIGFAQANVLFGKWMVTGGASLNWLTVNIQTVFPQPYNTITRNFNNQVAPRLALLYKLSNRTSFYASIAKGYSPPTTEQIIPTGSRLNISLQSAQGWNYQFGSRGYFANDRLYYDANVYFLQLSSAIVQRRDSAGGDYYVNAGGTEQAGAELMLRYKIIQALEAVINGLTIGASYTYSAFNYTNFMQLNADYSGKMLPGVAPHTIAVTLDLMTRYHIYLNLNCYCSDAIPLDDANTTLANSYTLLDARIGYRNSFRRFGLDIFAGSNNLLNETYSLGNDINAAGGRYFNAAPGINYFAGISLTANY